MGLAVMRAFRQGKDRAAVSEVIMLYFKVIFLVSFRPSAPPPQINNFLAYLANIKETKKQSP